MYSGRVYCAPSGKKKASRYYQRSADLGNPKAQYALAEDSSLDYKRQYGDQAISKQCKKAVNTYEYLANQNDIEAQYELGKIYNGSLCMSRNDLKAFRWFKKAAENGHVDVQYELSSMYRRGIYLSKANLKAYQNDEKSSEWCQKAADNGNGYVEYRIGRMYLSGARRNDISKDVTLGMRYLENSALHDNYYAQLRLSNIYKNGIIFVSRALEKFKNTIN